MVLQGAEPPRIFTGMENVIGKYEFSTSRRDQDMHILDIVPKFRPATWKHGDDMPCMTVICRGLKDGKIHYFDVERYTHLHDGFGYINDRPDIDLISAENDLPQEAVITRSPAWKGNDYCMGVNANVVFMTHWAVTEDAVVISESLAKKCTNLDIRQEKLSLGVDDILLNIYGDNDMDEYKVIPDIGETVGPNGILAAIRTKNSTSYVSDMTPEALMTTEPLHDELIKAPPGSKILDIDVYINFAHLNKIDENDSAYSQLLRIFRDHQYYYDEIITKYRQYKEWGMEIDDAFNSLVLRAMEMTANPKFRKKGIKLCETREPIEFINVVITYAHERHISVGSKLTGREGGKGVISAILPDEYMPVDEDGYRADIIMAPQANVNRMNPSQLLEQFWNRCADQAVRIAKAQKMGWKQAYAYFLDFVNEFRPAYATALDKYLLETDEKKKQWVEQILETGVIRLLAAWTKGRPYSEYIRIAKKYGVKRTPVTYKTKDPKTGIVTTTTTKTGALIGSKYLLYLGKIPDESLVAVEVGHVNQFEIPIKPKSKRIKNQSLIGLTPMKFGEDEVCILSMSLGSAAVARMMCIHSAAPTVVKDLIETLLTDPCPTQLLALPQTTQEIINQNRNVAIFLNMMGATGYDVAPHPENFTKQEK
jgi:hypothetical protein